VTLLQQLSTSGTSVQFGRNVREKIIELGVSMTHIQRELRLRALATKRDEGRYRDEANNWGRMNWAPRDYPDWLLLELEANVLLRPDQVDVALATISPTSKANSVLQMNMGQGWFLLSPIPTQHGLTKAQAKHPASFQWRPSSSQTAKV
jgi:hypothetical protein